jgi:protein-disulfide isomerase
MIRRRTTSGLILAVCSAALATAAWGAGETDQLIKYYRKKANLNPSQNVTVDGLKDSAIKGAKEGTLQIGNPPQVKKVPFLMSADGRYAVFGGTEDLTVDPSKAVMEKISLKGKPLKGPDKAKVTIVKYSDFQCPFCARGHDVMAQVLAQYPNDVRYVFKNFPLNFHPWAEPAAVAIECVGQQDQEAYWKVYDGLFAKQKEINPQNVKEKVDEMLQGSKVDMAKFNDCYNNKKTLDQVKAEMAEGQSVGVTGTPGFIVNGRLVSGAQPFEVFKNIIEDEIASAK